MTLFLMILFFNAYKLENLTDGLCARCSI